MSRIDLNLAPKPGYAQIDRPIVGLALNYHGLEGEQRGGEIRRLVRGPNPPGRPLPA